MEIESGKEQSGEFRTGYVAIVGEPNVGKSTLVNALVGAKLSIVTHKPQTTRKSVLGLLTTDHAQIIFLDTPGVLTPKYLLQEKMVGYVDTALQDADVILLMLDATDPTLERLAETPLGNVAKIGKPIILLLNKFDLLKDRNELLPVAAKFSEMGIFTDVVPISALHTSNTGILPELITKYLPLGPALYDPELISEQPTRFFASELIREQVLKLYQQEIPYAVEVSIIEFKEREEPAKLFISAEIVVERDTQKAIIIGKHGESLKKLGERARHSIEEFLERGVYLELFVKVRKDWRESESRLRGFGY
jgi:GTP-binding protein Era